MALQMFFQTIEFFLLETCIYTDLLDFLFFFNILLLPIFVVLKALKEILM